MKRPRRPIDMHRSSLLLIAAVLGTATMPFPQTSARASCPAPYLKDMDRLVLRIGSTTTVEGRAFTDGCQDSMSCTATFGCDSCSYDAPAPVPMNDVTLRLQQRHRTWDLGVADAKSAQANQGWVSWTVKLPSAVQPGPAELIAEHAQPVSIKIGGRARTENRP